MLPSVEALSHLPLFNNLTVRELQEVAAALDAGRAAAGTLLIGEGDPPGTPLHVLLSGSAAFVKAGADGRAQTVGVVRAPGIFGEIDVLAGRPALAGVLALEDVTFATLGTASVGHLCAAGCPGILKVLVNLTAALRYRTHTTEARIAAARGRAAGRPCVGPVRQMLYAGWDTRRLA